MRFRIFTHVLWLPDGGPHSFRFTPKYRRRIWITRTLMYETRNSIDRKQIKSNEETISFSSGDGLLFSLFIIAKFVFEIMFRVWCKKWMPSEWIQLHKMCLFWKSHRVRNQKAHHNCRQYYAIVRACVCSEIPITPSNHSCGVFCCSSTIRPIRPACKRMSSERYIII